MRHATVIAAVLMGCAGGEAPRTFRDDPDVILASKADFAIERMNGAWNEVARFPDGTCSGGTVRYAARGRGADIEETCDGVTRTGRATLIGPGRLRTDLGGVPDEIWVLWVDTGYRTALLVAPDGSGGRVLNREPVLPPDRRNAVLEVLDFNGFNASELVFSPSG